jgi:uncharacterized protein with GYD domain
MPKELYSWNDDVYGARQGARLHFWRFAFVPDYDRDGIFQTVRSCFRDAGITSYIIYEVYGEYDLLVRFWAPREISAEDLGQAFEGALKTFTLYHYEYTLVNTILHWVWQDVEQGNPHAVHPNPDALFEIKNRHVEEIAKYNALVMDVESSSPTKREDEYPTAPEWVELFVKSDLLRPLPLNARGVKFYITFDHPRRPMRTAERENVVRQIVDKCVETLRETRRRLAQELDGSTIQLSFYSGSGPLTDFLIMARAPDAHFYSFSRALIFGLHELGLHRSHYMRTYTSVLADRHFAEFVERPVTADRPDESILAAPESESLEFKASFALDVRSFLNKGERNNARFVTDNIIKAVCGLLNAPVGGMLIVGVLELERELERVENREEAFATLINNYPTIPPRVAVDDRSPYTKVLLGIDEEFPDWDDFVRSFESAIRTRIEPNPVPYVEPQRLIVQGQTIAVITVRPAPMWFYATVKDNSPEFFVRELASTRSYSGTSVDLYRRANPREGFVG